MSMTPPVVDPTAQPPAPAPAAPSAPSPLTIDPPPAPAPALAGRQWSEADHLAEIERVRKEEHDKLYPQLSTLHQTQAELDAYRAREQQMQQEEAERQRLAAEEAERQRIAELTSQQRMDEIQRKFEEEQAALRRDLETERAMREKEVQFSQLLQFKTRRLMEEEDNIAPQLIDLVSGNTEAEIEASIERMKAKTADIVQSVADAQGQRTRSLPLPPTSGPAIDTQSLPEAGQRSFSPEDIRDMSMDEYEALRPALLGATSQRVRSQGAYAP